MQRGRGLHLHGDNPAAPLLLARQRTELTQLGALTAGTSMFPGRVIQAIQATQRPQAIKPAIFRCVL
ncbi:hypothetical protein VL15_25155 [Burkholderia cepacia]|uniref:Uncharacterized protein n=1 Tax=Burkholderia cepacia TaxID=292 RepID=A0A0J5WQX7_BURCE|nr:hypothetical protein VL15_25155 [Burkholderia cepacia]